MNALDVTIRNHEDIKGKKLTSNAVCIFVKKHKNTFKARQRIV